MAEEKMENKSKMKKSSGDGPKNKGNKKFDKGGKNKKFVKQRELAKPFKKKVATGDTERAEISTLLQLYKTFDFDNFQEFKHAPLSCKTKMGLHMCSYDKPTRIQRETLALALKGRDVLGAAKTGSGKTLAFVVPIFELLFREMWTRMDGLGALIITPTRELAYQIFEVLKKVGHRHDFSAGLIIGGTDIGFERQRLNGCNILICTPGRLLQHMDQNALFDTTNLKILVLDEADRCLDMGFEKEMNAILANLPPERQTLLFSATQTKSVKDLARLSLNNPAYVSVHENADKATPDQLHQDYLVCELHDKLNLLWSFLKNHKGKKMIVFMSCCKQVQFMNTVIRRLRPGTTVLHLHGNMPQPKRMMIYDEFTNKTSAILLATDLAARGLDFPRVDWVMQLDCPEDVDTYIHRVGRTARFEHGGKALLVLQPSEEEKMHELLKQRKIPINKIAVNPKRFYDIQRKVESMCARDVELKNSAQRCFNGYLKYVFMQKNKEVFAVEKLDLDLYARSLGLIVTPRARFLQKYFAQKGISMSSQKKGQTLLDAKNDSDEDSEADGGKKKDVQLSKKIEKYSFDDGIESDDDIFTKKKGRQAIDDIEVDDEEELEEETEQKGKNDVTQQAAVVPSKKSEKVITKIQAAKKILKKKHIIPNKKVVFNEDGEAEEDVAVLTKTKTGVEERGGINIELSKELMKEQDKIDKQAYRDKIKAKHREARLKAKAERRAAAMGLSGAAQLDVVEGGSEQEEDEENDGEVDGEAQEMSDNGNDRDDDDGSESGDDDESEEERPLRKGGKRPVADDSESDDEEEEDEQRHVVKAPRYKKQKFGLRRSQHEGAEEIDTGLDLAGDEELALKLLQG